MGWFRDSEDPIARRDIAAHLAECIAYRTRAEGALTEIRGAQMNAYEKAIEWRQKSDAANEGHRAAMSVQLSIIERSSAAAERRALYAFIAMLCGILAIVATEAAHWAFNRPGEAFSEDVTIRSTRPPGGHPRKP